MENNLTHGSHAEHSTESTHRAVASEGVNFSFKGGHQVFVDLKFSVPNGQFVSVVGPSGCGKSTFLRLLAGLIVPTSGDIIVFNERVVEPLDAISLVFQSDTLLPWRTAVRNVGLGIEDHESREVARRLSMKALETVGLAGSHDKYPHQLSGGMRQRVNLARALVQNPKLLLMDEPFGALDAQTREEQQENLLRVWEKDKKTVIFVTHDIEEAVILADRVIVLGKAPRGIVYDCEINLPRPRSLATKSNAGFAPIVETIRGVIGSHRI